MDDRSAGTLILIGSLAGVVVYFYLVFLSPWARLTVQITDFITFFAMMVMLAWIGYRLSISPSPVSRSRRALYARARKKERSKAYSKNVDEYELTRSFYEKGYGGKRERMLLSQYCKGPLVLNLACGSGRLLPFLISLGFFVVGIDISNGMLRRAREKAKKAELVVSDAECLPFRSNLFNEILCSRAFKLFPKPNSALLEVKRCIHNGYILFSIENKQVLWVRLAVRLTLLHIGDFRYYEEDILSMFKNAGVIFIQKKCVIYFSRNLYEFAYKFNLIFLLRLLLKIDENLDRGRNVLFVGK